MAQLQQCEMFFDQPVGASLDGLYVIYNLRGERIVRLVDDHFAAGNHFVTWTGTNANGQKVASGIYFARFTTQDMVLTQRLVMIK